MPVTEPKTERRQQPKYSQVASSLRQRIISGDLRPGDRLPSYTEGKAQGITQPTIQRAHSILEREGLIFREPRRGTFVAEPSHRAQHVSRQSSSTLMQHTVGVISSEALGASSYLHEEGWAYVGTLSVLESLRRSKLNGLMLPPEHVQARDLEHLRRDPPRGFLVMDIGYSESQMSDLVLSLQATHAPVVVLGNFKTVANCDRLSSDHYAGAKMLSNWLIKDQGRRRILNLWPQDCDKYWFDDKWVGYKQAITEAGLEVIPPALVLGHDVPLKMTEAWFNDQVRIFAGCLVEHLSGANPVDAIMAYSDYVVPIIAAACRLFRLKPNEDVAIVGYDNYVRESPLRAWEPTLPMATVEKQNRLLGKEMSELFLARISGKLPVEPQVVLIPPLLITL